MATYTDNYTMTKPTYAEQADISVINANMDIIDNVMHSSQISLAPAYDINETYNTGDIVMHELLMYKCLEDNVTGAWDSTKWTRTTAGEESGGGADLDIYGEASGTAEASFSDGAEASLVECEIGIVPTQDLHGYSKPWAGGAGKNKLDKDELSNVNTSFQSKQITLSPNTEYTISTTLPKNNSNSANLFMYLVGGSPDTSVNGVWEGQTRTLTTDGTGIVVIGYRSVDYTDTSSTWYLSHDMQIEQGSQATTFEPYSNICPISGHTDVTVTVASTSGGSGEDYTVSLGTTYYGGNLDVTTGELEVTWENIASYAGETLTGEWLSSLDEYSTLGTPTTGAQVVYELATPQTFNLTPTQVKTLLGQNYVSHDGGGTISLVYVKGDAPIKPNPADAEIPLTGLEIDGEKFKIAGKEYSETSLYTYTGSTRQTTLELSDDFTEYDAIEFTFGWNLGGDDFETVNAVPSSKIVSGIFINVGGEGRYNYISKGTSNSEIILATATGSWDGSSIIKEVRGIKY